jgi:hypothetical protein
MLLWEAGLGLNNLMVIWNAPWKILQIVSKTSFKVSLAETSPAISPNLTRMTSIYKRLAWIKLAQES